MNARVLPNSYRRFTFTIAIASVLIASVAGCGGGAAASGVRRAVLARIAVEVASELVLEVLDNYQGESYIPPAYMHEYESTSYCIDPQTGWIVHANRLGGLNYWTPNKTMVGFSAYYAPTREFHYFDGWGNRIY